MFFDPRDRVAEFEGGSAGARGVFVDIGQIEFYFLKKIYGLLKIFFCFAGKTDYNIGGDFNFRIFGSYSVNNFKILRDRIGSLHRF